MIGGGIQGCCIALELAARGVEVSLFEREKSLLSRASSNNEGKIHLGYVYAGDRSDRTARTMLKGALAFHPFMAKMLEHPRALAVSKPFIYAVHRSSQKPVNVIERHFAAVQQELSAIGRRGANDYFGQDVIPSRRLSAAELGDAFDPEAVTAAFQTSEIAILPTVLCAALRDRIVADPRIEAHLEQEAADILGDGPYTIVTRSGENAAGFDHVVNAAWEGRLVLDSRRGLRPCRPWLHRVKYGFRLKTAAIAQSTTIMLGAFGDTVAYADGSAYLSWYPAGMCATGAETKPPAIEISDVRRKSMLADSVLGLAEVVPSMRSIAPQDLVGAQACGGVITAFAETDIVDPASYLHKRSEIGVHSAGNYHSVDTGKFTMAPYFAVECAERTAPKD